MENLKRDNLKRTNLKRANITGRNNSGTQANKPLRLLTVSSILGDKIVNPSGEDLGRIMDMMLNIKEGKIEYVVIEFGGFLGINQKYFGVPFHALSIHTDRHAFVLNETKESLEKYPGFDKAHWPDTNSHIRNRAF